MDSTRSKFVLFIWGLLLFLLYFRMTAYAWDRWIYGSFIPDIVFYLLVLMLLIPAAFLTARFLVIKIPIKIHFIGILAVALFFSWNVYDEHREKGLDELFTYQSSNFEAMNFNYEGWRTEETEPVEELLEFLSQYRVKKMKDSEWDSNVSMERGFVFLIFPQKGKGSGASIHPTRLMLFNKSGYYKVTRSFLMNYVSVKFMRSQGIIIKGLYKIWSYLVPKELY